MDKQLVRSFLEAFAAGDAIGKATEYCSMEEIAANYSSIDRILPPSESLSHSELPFGSVTDDTEQVVCLLDYYTEKGMVGAYDTAMCLLSWVESSKVAKTTMGPSSISALNAIKAGEDINFTGIYGTTCGGIMRSPASFFVSNEETLEENTFQSLLPTHNTRCAMEAALSYNYALLAASKDNDIETILDEAERGCDIGSRHGYAERTSGVGPSVKSRIKLLRRVISSITSEKELKTLLYSVLGTTLSSVDVASAVYAIFIYAKGNVLEAIRIASEVGGDTDTIACLVAGLSTFYSKGHNIPKEYIDIITNANNLDLDRLSQKIIEFRENRIKETIN